MMECKLCKRDMELLLEAAKEIEAIGSWADHAHPSELKALRRLGVELDRIRLLGLLVKTYKLLKLLRRPWAIKRQAS